MAVLVTGGAGYIGSHTCVSSVFTISYEYMCILEKR